MTVKKINEIKTNIKCFKKKKYVSLFIFSATKEEVEEKEKKRPNRNKSIKLNRILLSTFRQ